MRNTRKKELSRRSFIKTGTTAATVFSIVPGHVLGANGKTPPSEKLNIAGIGIGGMGRGNIGACKGEMSSPCVMSTARTREKRLKPIPTQPRMSTIASCLKSRRISTRW